MSGGIEHSERSVNAWMVENLTTRNGITKAPRQAGRVPAKINVIPEPPALPIDVAIAVFAVGVFLGGLIV